MERFSIDEAPYRTAGYLATASLVRDEKHNAIKGAARRIRGEYGYVESWRWHFVTIADGITLWRHAETGKVAKATENYGIFRID